MQVVDRSEGLLGRTPCYNTLLMTHEGGDETVIQQPQCYQRVAKSAEEIPRLRNFIFFWSYKLCYTPMVLYRLLLY